MVLVYKWSKPRDVFAIWPIVLLYLYHPTSISPTTNWDISGDTVFGLLQIVSEPT